jgi:hypothetical protein
MLGARAGQVNEGGGLANAGRIKKIGVGRESGEFVGSLRESGVSIGRKNGRPEWIRTIDLFRVKEAL